MLTFDVSIDNRNAAYENCADDFSTYIYLCDRNGQIAQRDHLFSQNGTVLTVSVACPGMDSFDIKNSNVYALDALSRLEQNSGAKVKWSHTGVDVDVPISRIPLHSSHYILRWGNRSSPLLCGDSRNDIPLYKIPYTHDDGKSFDDIRWWDLSYKRIYGLWICSQPVAETFALGQLQEIDSELNLMGMAVREKIEQLTGVPTYYFLFNARDWTMQEDMDRKCPITGNDWRIDGATSNDFMAFKCDESRLMSELSHHCCDAP